MSIFRHFSTRTQLPIKIDEIRDHILDTGVIDEIEYCPVDIDSQFLRGICHIAVHNPIPRPYASESVRARIYYCNSMPLSEQRLAVCKELLHTLDSDREAAQSESQVLALLEEISIPVSAGPDLLRLGLPTISDTLGEVKALSILCPIAAVRICREMLQDGALGVTEFTAMAEVPDRFGSLILGDKWESVVQAIERLGDRTSG